MPRPDPSNWTFEDCWHYLDAHMGIDLNTVEVDDHDLEGWRNYVAARLDDREMEAAEEFAIPLANGCTLRYEKKEGSHIRICDSDGNEILIWVHTEWEEDPESVIPAIFGASQQPLDVLLEGRTLEDGCWNYYRDTANGGK